MTTLKDLYIDELKDLWSANDQMEKIVGELAKVASDSTLADRLKRSRKGIAKHTETLKSVRQAAGGEIEKEHCNGMAGLVTEARNHALDAGLEGAALDVAIIAQYQRMCHYGIAGFGTAKAFAEALGEQDAAGKLDTALDETYGSDEYMSDLAERSRNMDAAA